MDHPDRYWSVMFLDAYTHVTYVSRRIYGVSGASVRIPYDPEKEPDHDQPAQIIPIGTPTVWVLIRTLVEGSKDLPRARAIQERFTVTPLVSPSQERIPPPPGRPDQVYLGRAYFFDEPVRPWLSIPRPPGIPGLPRPRKKSPLSPWSAPL